MGRLPTLDRDEVLDLAGRIPLTDGTAALTIDAVAKAARFSKGGIRPRFGTKDDLISAMLERRTEEYETRMNAGTGRDPSPATIARAHIGITMAMDAAERTRAAGFVAALISAPRHRAGCRAWHAELSEGLDPRRGGGPGLHYGRPKAHSSCALSTRWTSATPSGWRSRTDHAPYLMGRSDPT